MKKNIDTLYILTISKNDEIGLQKTISSLDQIKTNLKLVHIIKIFSNDLKSIETLKEVNFERIIIKSEDSGIYNAMNIIFEKVPINSYSLFLNSGDTIHGIINSQNLEDFDECLLIKTYKKEYSNKNIIKTKSNFYDGMPFCHQSFIFKKKFGMKFSEDYKICGDYDFIIKWFSKRFTSPLKIRKLNKLHTIFDINGISSKKRFERDIEGYFVILRNYGILKSIFYLINRIKKYLEVKIY